MRHRRNPRHGFSLTEVLVVVVLIGILSGIAVGTFRFFDTESREQAGESTLVSVAAAAESYYLQRSVWPNAGTLDGMGDGGVTISSASSTGVDVVSMSPITVDGLDGVGLAVRIGQECLTLRVLPPEESYESYVERRALQSGQNCEGASA